MWSTKLVRHIGNKVRLLSIANINATRRRVSLACTCELLTSTYEISLLGQVIKYFSIFICTEENNAIKLYSTSLKFEEFMTFLKEIKETRN